MSMESGLETVLKQFLQTKDINQAIEDIKTVFDNLVKVTCDDCNKTFYIGRHAPLDKVIPGHIWTSEINTFKGSIIREKD